MRGRQESDSTIRCGMRGQVLEEEFGPGKKRSESEWAVGFRRETLCLQFSSRRERIARRGIAVSGLFRKGAYFGGFLGAFLRKKRVIRNR
jgi:hypothetical protein